MTNWKDGAAGRHLGRLTSVRSEGERPLYRMELAKMWGWLLRQPASFWCINAYLFFEYVRPQSIYPVIEGLPFGEVCLALSLVALLVEGKVFRRFNLADAAMTGFGGVVLASMAMAFDPGHAISGWKPIANWFIAYYLITNLVDTENRFFVFMLAFLLYSFKMSQFATRSWMAAGFTFRRWGVVGAPGWFRNSGELAVQLAVFVPLSVCFFLALKKHWPTWKKWVFGMLPVTGIVGVIATSSRGGQLGVAATVIVLVAKSKYKMRAFLALVLVAVSAWTLMPEAQKQRFYSAGDDPTSRARLTYWENGLEIMRRHPILGIGYENWTPYYIKYYEGEGGPSAWLKGQVPHNIFIEAGAELGYTGLLAFLFLIGSTLYLNRETRRLAPRCRGDPSFFRYMAHGLDAALAGYLVSGFFVTVLYYPYFWINLAMTSALYTVAHRQAKANSGSVPDFPQYNRSQTENRLSRRLQET